MVRCAVLSCKNDSRKLNKKNNNISFHRFPKSPEIIDAWVKAIKRSNWEPDIQSFICSMHFNASFISETKKGLRKLVHNAIPELYLEENSSSAVSVKVEEGTLSPVPASISVLEDVTSKANDSPRNKRLKLPLRHAQGIAKKRRENSGSAVSVKVEEGTLSPVPASISVLEEVTSRANDSPQDIRLKRRLRHAQEIAKKRRLRINALYLQINRLKKKVHSLEEQLYEFHDKLKNVLDKKSRR